MNPNCSLFPYLGDGGINAVRLYLIWSSYNQGPKKQAVPGNRSATVKVDKYVSYIRFWNFILSFGQSMHWIKTIKYEPGPHEYKEYVSGGCTVVPYNF